MEDKIRLLPEKVANQIAAGEIVHSPASVVKEMVENAIDAKSKEVVVNYRRGGHDLIQIVDDGIGMSPNDARMAFEKHATSKIKKASDLYSLATYGFRGEALASIASVSQLELRTRPHDAEIGTLTTINGGTYQSQEPAMCPAGSQFFIRNIFYSVPARRKFLEEPKRCANKIKKEFQRIALCYPEIGFSLYGDDKPIYQLRPSTLANRIVDIIGRTMKNNLLEVSTDTTIVKLKGFISRPSAAKKSSYDQYLFVNGRYFYSSHINSAMLRAYEKLISPELNPSFFLYLEVDPARIDVNIHPQKTEVKFADADEIWQIVNAAARETLAKTGAVSLLDFDDESGIEIPVIQQGVRFDEPRAMSNSAYNPFEVEAERDLLKSPNTLASSYTSKNSSSSRGALRSSSPKDVWEQDFEEYESAANEKPLTGATEYFSPQDQFETVADDWESLDGEDFKILNDDIERTNMEEGAFVEQGKGQIEAQINGQMSEQEQGGQDRSQDNRQIRNQAYFHSSRSESETFETDFYDTDFYEEIPSSPQQQLSVLPYSSAKANKAIGEIIITNEHFAWCKVGANMRAFDLRKVKERILYDSYLSMLREKKPLCQSILFPIELGLNDAEYSLIDEFMVELSALGFNIKLCSKAKIEILGAPADIALENIDKLIYELLRMMEKPEIASEQRTQEIAALMAQNATKYGIGRIGANEARELISQLLSIEQNGMTASGKTISWEITPNVLKKGFKL